MAMTLTEILLLRRIESTLTGHGGYVTASERVQDHLESESMRIYLDTWVRPLLRDVIKSGKGELSAADLKYLYRI